MGRRATVFEYRISNKEQGFEKFDELTVISATHKY